MVRYNMSDVAGATRSRECWWVVLVVDPIATRIVWLLANFTRVHPLAVTGASLFLYATAATLFALSVSYITLKPWILYAAAISYLFAFGLDCVDGELARLTGKTTEIGRYVDRVGGFFGETAVIATFTYAALTEWPPIPIVLLAGIYWVGVTLEVTVWFGSRNESVSASGSSWQLKNSFLNTVDNWLRKHRLGSHPSAVEGGVIAFGVSPFFHMHPAFIGVGAFLVWIDQFRFLAKLFIRANVRQKVQKRESL